MPCIHREALGPSNDKAAGRILAGMVGGWGS